jgi:hypothetical protein
MFAQADYGARPRIPHLCWQPIAQPEVVRLALRNLHEIIE